jgi:putative ABC transport system permease protein
VNDSITLLERLRMGFSFVDQTWLDLRVGLRAMARDRGATLTALASIALGIAATTAMFSVVFAVIIDPFPYKDVQSLASIKVWEPGARGFRTGYTVDQYLDLRERSTIFEGVIASTISDVEWTGGDAPQRLRGNHGPFNTFEVMGVAPLIGRTPTTADAVPGAAPVVVLGYRFWQRQFGASPGVIGTHLTLNGVTREVIGVMPPRFMWRGADVYLPTHFRRGEPVEGVRFVHVLGRVRPGVSDAQAEADLRPIIEHLRQLEPKAFPEKWRVGLLPFKETFPSGIRPALWILFGATGLLLVIACANVSNLLLSRAAGRRLEMAVRSATGATRRRLARQLLTESLMLGVTGGAAGVALAYALLRVMIGIVPPDTIPDESEIVMNVPVLAFSAVLSVGTALLFGLVPAWQAGRADLTDSLKHGGRGAVASSRGLFRSSLVVAEVALSLVLLTGAALMLQDLLALQRISLGFPAEHVLTMRVPVSSQRYPDPTRRVVFLRELLAGVDSVPGVIAAGINTGLHPFGGWRMQVDVDGGQQDSRSVQLHQIDPGYLRVFQRRLVAGRALGDDDVQSALHTTLVNQAFVRRYLPGRSGVGAIVRIPQLQRPPASLGDPSFQVAGVLEDAVNDDPKEGTQPEVFIPYTVLGVAQTLVVRTSMSPQTMTRAVTAQVYKVDKDQPVADIRTVADLMQRWVLSSPRFNVILLGAFAGLGLALATVGVYGVISTMVAHRTREIGLRMAMGATIQDVLLLVARRGLGLVAIGMALGLAASLAAGRLLARTMESVAAFDLTAFGGVCLVLLAAGCLACAWPAQRAARIDPASALRNE